MTKVVPIFFLCIRTIVAVAPPTAVAQTAFDPPTQKLRLAAERTTQPIVIDGKLTEPVWQTAQAATAFVQVEPNQGEKAHFETVVRMSYDDAQLYIAAFCRDTVGLAGIRSPDLRRDFDFFTYDLFGIVLDTYNDQRNSIAFYATPYGAQRDLLAFDDQLFDRDWDGVWRVETAVTDSGWTAEMAIPWATLRYAKIDSAEVASPASSMSAPTWGVQFVRNIRRANEITAWSPYPRSYSPNRMSYAGALDGLQPPPPSVNVRLQPYALGEIQRNQNARPQLGGELKWAISPNTVLDLTANTDFAQADVDRQVINLSRFGVFFPERRQFFLESASLFSLSVDNNLQPFFSRRIGLDAAGNPIPIDGGLRLVNRDPIRSFGALAIRTRANDVVGASNFGVLRYSQNISEQSRLGGLATVRYDEGALPTTNAVGTLDAFLRFSQELRLEAFVSGSLNRNREDNRDGLLGFAKISFENNDWSLSLTQSAVSPNYRAGAGFIARENVRTTRFGGYPILRPAWKPDFIRGFEPDFFVTILHRMSDGLFQEAQVSVAPVFILFQDGGVLDIRYERYWQNLSEPFAPVAGVSIAGGAYRYDRFIAYYSSDQSARVAFTVRGETGSYYDGTLSQADLSLNLRPVPHAAFSVRWIYNEFRNVGGEGTYRNTHLVAPELRLALNPKLQLIGFYQYNTAAERGTWNARLSWEFAPLSFVFVVFNDNRSLNERRFTSAFEQQQGILKISYIHQF